MLNQINLEQHLKTPFRFYPSVDSTNDLARDWLLDGAPHGAVVIADEQRQGRGRMGRTWYTPPNTALALSVILHPHAFHDAPPTMLGAVAIAEICESLHIADVAIKWPNDVQIQGRKAAGILPEAIWQADRLAGIVLGIGVNIRLDFNAELQPIAINLADVAPHLPPRPVLIAQLLNRILHWSNQPHSQHLFNAWHTRLNIFGKIIAIQDVQGVAETVLPDGALIVRDENNVQHRIIAGELHYITQKLEDD